jgi:DNA repair protein RecO (recombination protein O)
VNQLNTKAIVLSRTNYGEADRIVTVLTPSSGKLKLMAKGSRKIKSKLAGGIELFSLNDLTYILGKRDLGTLISSRMSRSYSNIVKNLDRVQLGYDLIKLINKVTEDHTDEEYFLLLESLLEGLNEDISTQLLRCWFKAQLIKFGGHSPNLYSDDEGQKLDKSSSYNFDLAAMTFTVHENGRFKADQIKVLRLVFGDYDIKKIAKVRGIENNLSLLSPIVDAMLKDHLNS